MQGMLLNRTWPTLPAGAARSCRLQSVGQRLDLCLSLSLVMVPLLLQTLPVCQAVEPLLLGAHCVRL